MGEFFLKKYFFHMNITFVFVAHVGKWIFYIWVRLMASITIKICIVENNKKENIYRT